MNTQPSATPCDLRLGESPIAFLRDHLLGANQDFEGMSAIEVQVTETFSVCRKSLPYFFFYQQRQWQLRSVWPGLHHEDSRLLSGML